MLWATAVVGGGVSDGWGEAVGNPKLDSWIDIALAGSPSLDVSRAAVRVAAARGRDARAARRPALDARIDVREGRHRSAMTGMATEDLAPISPGVDAAWELDVFGRIRSEVGAATFAELAEEHLFRERELALAAEVVRRYIEGHCFAGHLAVREAEVAAHQAICDYLAGRVEAGLERPEVREQADAARLLARRRVAQAREDLETLEARWRYLLPDESVPGAACTECGLPEELPEPPRTEELHAYALNRPDVQAAQALWRGAEQSARAQARNRLPSLSAIATAEGDMPSPADEPEEWVAWAGLRLSLPVLAPKTGAAVESGRAEEDMHAALYRESVRLALFDIRARYVERVHGEKRWRAGREEAMQLKTSFESVQRQFEQGLEPVSVLERSRLRWLAAEERRLRLHALVLQRHIALLRACGGPELARSE